MILNVYSDFHKRCQHEGYKFVVSQLYPNPKIGKMVDIFRMGIGSDG